MIPDGADSISGHFWPALLVLFRSFATNRESTEKRIIITSLVVRDPGFTPDIFNCRLLISRNGADFDSERCLRNYRYCDTARHDSAYTLLARYLEIVMELFCEISNTKLAYEYSVLLHGMELYSFNLLANAKNWYQNMFVRSWSDGVGL